MTFLSILYLLPLTSHFLQLVSVISQNCARCDCLPVSKTGTSSPGRVSVSGGQMMSLGGNLPKTVYHLPPESPPPTFHWNTLQLVCVREGSHTPHLLHPEAAPLMGVPSIVVLLLVPNLQE